jgi:hypothetical protein
MLGKFLQVSRLPTMVGWMRRAFFRATQRRVGAAAPPSARRIRQDTGKCRS